AAAPVFTQNQPQRPQPGQPAPPAPPGQPAAPSVAIAPPPPPPREGQPVNIKVELTITDQHAGAAPAKKALSAVIGDGQGGFVRSSSMVGGPLGEVPLNVDVEPRILADGKIRLHFNLQYDLPSTPGADVPRPTKTTIRESITLILENGKSLLAAQSADPVIDRQVTVEVKATILR